MKTQPGTTFTCPWWLLFTFDNPLRKLIHDPIKILSPFVESGDTVLDVGCGMGYFSLGLAELVGEKGKVIAADLQPQMLAGLSKRAASAGLDERIHPQPRRLEDRAQRRLDRDVVAEHGKVRRLLGMGSQLEGPV